MSNYTYILKCADETLYCGWTNDLEKRLEAHNSGKGAKYTRSRLPVELIYYEELPKLQILLLQPLLQQLLQATRKQQSVLLWLLM